MENEVEVGQETVTTATKRPAPTVETVQMEDGRTVTFTGKARMNKEIIIQDSRAAVRFDFKNGQTLLAGVPEQHMLYAAAHGYSQKLGDDVAGAKDDKGQPISDEDRFLAVEALHNFLSGSMDWNKVRSGTGGDSVSGASIVLKALVEVSGKTLAEVKANIEKRLSANEARWAAGGSVGPKPTRRGLYALLRQPDSAIGKVITRLEAEAAAGKTSAVLESADDVAAELFA